MKATGIVRRVDDLGRIVIPRELRRTLKILEGDPLEIFVENGGVWLRKYQWFNRAEWERAAKVLSPIIDEFAILDGCRETMACRGVSVRNIDEARSRDDLQIQKIVTKGDTVAYLVARKDCAKKMLDLAAEVLKQYLEEL